jgi:transcriptional regulator with XRE-family HTH domain
MITNERQLQITRGQIDRFTAALDAINQGSLVDSGLDPLLQDAQRDSIAAQLEEMRREIEEYEQLKAGEITHFDFSSLAALPDILIRARIAAGLSQKDLALRLDLKEQQVQRYEASRYEGAGFQRIAEIFEAIGLKLTSNATLLRAGSIETLFSRFALLGVSESFIRRRLVPQLGSGQRAIGLLLDRIKAIYGWEPAQLEAASPPPLEVGAALARFKMPRGRDERSATAYTAYAYHLATICAAAMADQPRQRIPTGWREFRTALLSRYDQVNLHTTLSFAWDLGVVILPLRDPGGFHGACWRIAGVNVVVLKQMTAFPARWLFDLIHELFHCGQNPDETEFAWIEESELSDERRTSREEQHAMWFAGQVGLDGRAEELAAIAMKLANDGFLPKLKQSVVAVAAEQGVSASYLANYLAYRLSLQGENWWGTAANLQERDCDPFAVARDMFFERFDFRSLDGNEVELLGLALDDEVSDG